MSKMINVRLDDRVLAEVDQCRDPESYPTLSDFVRAALHLMCREVKRERMRAEVQRLVRDEQDRRLAQAMAEENIAELAERLEKADRGEL